MVILAVRITDRTQKSPKETPRASEVEKSANVKTVDLKHIDLLFIQFFHRKQGTVHSTCMFQKVYSSAFVKKAKIFGRTSEFWIMAMHIPLSAFDKATLGQKTNTND